MQTNTANGNVEILSRHINDLLLPENFYLPDGLTVIDDQLFASPSRPIHFSLPRTVTTIGAAAFENCQLDYLFDIENNKVLKSVSESAFYNTMTYLGFGISGQLNSGTVSNVGLVIKMPQLTEGIPQ